ncbi:MAG: phosphatase PAP2 family protein [Saprospiraceae bacterium]
MFQTDLHIWLQEFDNEWIVHFFKFMTALGYMEFFMVSLIIVFFGLHFRKGFILLLIVLWTAAVTLVMKDTFDLPRPYMVENEVQILDGEVNTDMTLLDDADATHFFELLPTSTMDYFDNQPIPYGFPSGHTSIAVVFWGTLMLLFRKRWLSILCVSLIILIPFSRIYLGVHFIADVLGGYLVGVTMLWLFYRLVIREEAMVKYLKINKHPFAFDFKNFLIFVAPFIWLTLLNDTKYWVVPATLLGFGLGFMLSSQKGLPNETGSISNRIARVISTLVLFGGLAFLLEKIFVLTGLQNVAIANEFIKYILVSFVTIWLGIWIHIKLGWAEKI